MADGIALSQDELNRVLNNIRNDNSERENKPVSSGISLSQADLDRLFGSGSSSTVSTGSASPEKAAPAATPAAGTGTPPASGDAQASDSASAATDAARAAKIAERKARAAEMLARVNASSPKRITVIYGSTLRKGEELAGLAPGDMLELDRVMEEAAEIQVDGKPFAYGYLGKVNGNAAVKITRIL
ncbi:MAG: FliM/FliN family flagellar motor C-terminal domain-containing protein [Treponema sp.]|nr:FliM/FliN family flagellar motor C-terminal domain-containing protein [Treponema sp.]